MDLLDSMKVYVLAVEKGSLSAAATACGISATMAGNHLRTLEKRLGMQLLNRVREEVGEIAKVEAEPKLEGRQMMMVLAPR